MKLGLNMVFKSVNILLMSIGMRYKNSRFNSAADKYISVKTGWNSVKQEGKERNGSYTFFQTKYRKPKKK